MGRPAKADRNRLVIGLWRKGLTFDAVGAGFGISHERVRQIVARDVPDEYRAWRDQRAERSRALRTCPECGGRRSDRTGRIGGVCRECRRKMDADRIATHGRGRLWTRDAITDCIKAWAELYGSPPTAMDWNPSLAVRCRRRDIADRFYEDGSWPHTSYVQERFGSWNAGIEAAGFTPRRPGQRDYGAGTGRGLRPKAVSKALA